VTHEERVPDGSALTFFPDPSRPVVWMDQERNEMTTRTSLQSPGEASTVDLVVGTLTTTIPPADVCVLAPYVAQVELIKDSIGDIYPLLSILTVDSAQGSTFEYAVLSLVRSNTRHNVGFVSDPRRLNVMLSRARRGVTIVGCHRTALGSKGRNGKMTHLVRLTWICERQGLVIPHLSPF
jgi:superfamily I DNA and/or RNA helicase